MSLLRQVMQDSPAGYWPMQGATSAETAKDVVAGRNIAWNGGTHGSSGSAGGTSVLLDGATDYGLIAANAAFTTVGSFSVMLAFTMTANITAKTLLGIGPGAGDPVDMTFDFYNVNSWGLRAAMSGNAGATNFRIAAENMTPVVNRWYLMHAVWDNAASTLTKYLGGAFVSTGVSGGGSRDNRASPSIYVGRYNSSYGQWWPGRVAHLAFFTSALPVDRVRSHADSWLRNGVSY